VEWSAALQDLHILKEASRSWSGPPADCPEGGRRIGWERQLVEALLLEMEERKKLEVELGPSFVLELGWGCFGSTAFCNIFCSILISR
jgi:hypothetical protein